MVFSLSAQALAPGFYLLATLNTESLSAKGCKEGSVKLAQGQIFDSMVTMLEMQKERERERERERGVYTKVAGFGCRYRAGKHAFVLWERGHRKSLIESSVRAGR